MIKLSHSVSIIIPSIKRTGHRINQGVVDFVALDIAQTFTRAYGGCTVTNGYGYHAETSSQENVLILTSYAAKRIVKRDVFRIAEYVREQLEQESIAVIIDGSMYIV